MNYLKEFSPKESTYKLFKQFFTRSKAQEIAVNEEAIRLKKGKKFSTEALENGEFVFVKKGKLELYSTAPDGHKNIKGIFNSGALLENVTSNGIILCTAAITLMDSELVLLTKDMVKDILNFS